MRGISSVRVSDAKHPPQHAEGSDGDVDVHLILDWVDASLDCKNYRKVGMTSNKHARIHARTITESYSEIVANMQRLHPETIRRARVRVDVVAMLMHRLLLA